MQKPFALYNKGEAENLLGNNDLALKTFNKVVDFYERDRLKGQKSSDYYSALLRIAVILIDQGRGEEAVSYLDRVESLDSSDYRIQQRDIERASALIDQKEYTGDKGAYAVLEPYLKEDEWKCTFMQRKSEVDELRLLKEFKINRPEEFRKIEEQQQETKSIVHTYNKEFKRMAMDLLKGCVERYDGDNFKKTCTVLADYFHQKDDRKRELRCYHLYLCSKIGMTPKNCTIVD